MAGRSLSKHVRGHALLATAVLKSDGAVLHEVAGLQRRMQQEWSGGTSVNGDTPVTDGPPVPIQVAEEHATHLPAASGMDSVQPGDA